MSITTNGAGFTEVSPTGDSRVIYVSSSGSDSNNGLSSGAPKQTLAAGVALLRSGHPDQLLLKRGDTFSGSIVLNNSGGADASTPWLVGTYGTGARPIVKPSSGNHGVAMEGGLYQNIYILGIDFYCEHRDPGAGTPTITSTSAGVRYVGHGSNIFIEDCVMRFFINGVSVEGTDETTNRLDGLTVRRCILYKNYRNATAHGQGGYVNMVENILIEENVFYHNGWIDYNSDTAPDVFSHNLYVNTENVGTAHIIRKNYFLWGSSHGLQFRRGGTSEDNVASDNAIGILYGGGNTPVPGGVPIASARNVVVNGRDLDGSNARGWGFDYSNINSGTSDRDIATHDVSGHTNSHGFNVSTSVSGLAFTHRIAWDWTNPFTDDGASFTDVGGVSIGLAGANTPGFIDPNRTLGTYSLSLGHADSTEGFAEVLIARGIGEWDENYSATSASAFIRAGFAVNVSVTYADFGGGYIDIF